MAHRTKGARTRGPELVVGNLPPIERRCLMESGMRTKATRGDLAVIAAFFVGLLALAVVYLVPLVGSLIHHIPDLFAV